MATFKAIRGFKIKSLATDPSPLAEGQIWYNSTSGTLKVAPLVASWASGTSITTARAAMGAGGVPTAAWIAGGKTNNTPTNVTTNVTEEYNGSSWTAGGTMPQGGRSYGGGSGSLTTGIVVGGGPTTPLVGQDWVESYNGASWSTETATPAGLKANTVFGTEAAAVTAGQEPSTVNAVFNYDGGTWTTGGTMNTVRGYTTSAGTQSAGWIAGGWNAPGSPTYDANEHEQYNGSAWTVSPALTTARSAGGANGPQTSAIYFGGIVYPTSTTATETFDGSSWTTSPATLGTAVDEMGDVNNGTSNSTAMSVGGLANNAPPVKNITQEYENVAAAQTVTTS